MSYPSRHYQCKQKSRRCQSTIFRSLNSYTLDSALKIGQKEKTPLSSEGPSQPSLPINCVGNRAIMITLDVPKHYLKDPRGNLSTGQSLYWPICLCCLGKSNVSKELSPVKVENSRQIPS